MTRLLRHRLVCPKIEFHIRVRHYRSLGRARRQVKIRGSRNTRLAHASQALAIWYDSGMRKLSAPLAGAPPCFVALCFVALCLAFLNPASRAQTLKGGIDLTARITPTAARPEPVRQFTFYVLTRSYTDVAKDVAGA